jgi:hypothetical protein
MGNLGFEAFDFKIDLHISPIGKTKARKIEALCPRNCDREGVGIT